MRKIIYILASVCLLSGTAHAQEAMQIPANTSPEQIKTVFEEAMKAEFTKIDANNDGKLSKTEFLNYQLAEIKAKSGDNFDKLDRNLDGFLSEEEIFDAMQATMQKMGEQIQNIQGASENSDSVEPDQEMVDEEISGQEETVMEETSEPEAYSEPEVETEQMQ